MVVDKKWTGNELDNLVNKKFITRNIKTIPIMPEPGERRIYRLILSKEQKQELIEALRKAEKGGLRYKWKWS